MNHKELFIKALTEAYKELFDTDTEYAFSARMTTPEALALKMTEGLITGKANKEGKGIRKACRVCGIKQISYKAIQEYLTR